MSTSVRRRDGGYATFPNRWIDAGYMAKAPGSVTQVYLFLCRWADNSTWESAQPMRLIAAKCGLTENVVQKAVRTLENWGAVTRQWKPGPGGYNIWTLNELAEKSPELPTKTGGSLSDRSVSAPPENDPPYQPKKYQPKEEQPEEREGGRSRRKPEVPLPNDFTLTDSRLSYAIEKGMDEARAKTQFERLRNWATSKDERKRDWEATWRNWVLSDIEKHGVSTERDGRSKASREGRLVF